MKRLLSSVLLIPFFLMTACDNWLDIVPEEDMTTLETEFETRESAEDWLRSCYLFLQNSVASIRGYEGYLGADEFVGSDYALNLVDYKQRAILPGFKIAQGMQNSLIPYCDRWVYEETLVTSLMFKGEMIFTRRSTCVIFLSAGLITCIPWKILKNASGRER